MAETSGVAQLSPAWPMVGLRGLLAVLFGVVALVWPTISILTLAVLFGAYVLVDGISAIVHAFQHGATTARWGYVGLGALGIVAGILALLWPGLTVLVLVTLVGIWAVVTGVLEIAAALSMRRVVGSASVLVIVVGALSVLAGILILVQPLAGAYGIALIIGAYAVIYGIALIALAWRLRAARKVV
ncbi:HdeD family acid-resistance protein [Fodinicola feengrottensis]|uniref:HdeD family acid-resistance protein n=1 Tax=Fodinicola feengrottensis TaxID=435914 RepID=A0ABN2HYS6_9ACTN|nr:HdeD family acid-resistance protein [Fodinicola feengrottensis]